MNKAKRGRPFKRIPKLDATPEELARAMFAAVPPPDPSKRKRHISRPRKSAVAGHQTTQKC